MRAAALVAGALLAAAGCEKAAPPGPPATRSPPATTEEALARVRALDPPLGVELTGWDEIGVPAIRTAAMQPGPALALWRRLRGERDRIAMAAVLVDMEYDLDEMAAEEPSAALSRARSLAAERFFARRAAEPDRPGGGEVDARAIRLRPVRAPRFDFARAGAPAVRVVLIAGPPGELLAHLRFGGWNDCPEPHEHVVVLEAWRRRHGAELVFAGHDTLELLVERPPVARSDLARLAREQSLYCADIVTQGTGDVAALASELSGAGSWFFWWD